MKEKTFTYRIPAESGRPKIDLPDFNIKDNDGKIIGTHVKNWIVRSDGNMIEIVTDIEYKELEKYKV